MKTIAISGCGGFIGSYAIRYFLANGYKVRGLDNFFKGHVDSLLSYIGNPNFEFISGDVTKLKDCEKLCDGVDYIIHLAALVGFPICSRWPDLAKAVNVNGTANMLKARNEKTPFIFASTGSVYGKVEGICTEESPCNTTTVYGETKLQAETMVANEQNTVSYRMATAFGLSPCMRVQLLVNDFCHRAIHDKVINIFEADARRTFIHISDFIRALEFGFRNVNSLKHKIYNCGDNDLNWTKRELAEYIQERTKCHLFYVEFAKDLDCRDYEVSYQKLNNEGFFCKSGMKEGIDELLKAAPLLRVGNRYEPN
jgi:nucleoside-diphosphate-sugar epimerase